VRSFHTTSAIRSLADVVDVVIAAERRLTTSLLRIIEPEGCSVPTWRALRLLSDGEGHPMSELISYTLLAPPTATRLVDGMVADNLAYRIVDERDRRRVLVYATARGRALHERLDDRIRRATSAVLPEPPSNEVVDALRSLAPS